MDGSLALPMTRRMALNDLFDGEISGRAPAPAGSRLIDILGIRYIAVDDPSQSPGLRPFWTGEGASIVENTAALPRFQLFSRHKSVPTLEAALQAVANLQDHALVIENPPGRGHQTEMSDSAGEPSGGAATFKVLQADATSYRFEVDADRPAWFFLADANYPGWHAEVDGISAPLFSADVLGKAVGIPSGRHTLTIEFHSSTFHRGLWISVASTLLALLALLFGGKLASSRPREARGQA